MVSGFVGEEDCAQRGASKARKRKRLRADSEIRLFIMKPREQESKKQERTARRKEFTPIRAVPHGCEGLRAERTILPCLTPSATTIPATSTAGTRLMPRKPQASC